MSTGQLKTTKVLPLGKFSQPYDYIASDICEAGMVVQIPLGSRTTYGVVWEYPSQSQVKQEKLKEIKHTVPLPPLSSSMRSFLTKAAAYNMGELGNFLKLSFSVESVFSKPSAAEAQQDRGVALVAELSDVQSAAVQYLLEKLSPLNGHSTTLIDGVTGSGKTEVYFKAIEKAVESGGQVLVLVPEISLTVQLLEKFKARFGYSPLEWHSALTPARRRENWKKAAYGQARIIVGARSALFLPYPDLKLIVVDEEHEASYKQEEGVTYHARDMAVLRAREEGIACFLVSATPSVETFMNALSGKYGRVRLAERYNPHAMPVVNLVDLRLDKLLPGQWISRTLHDRILKTLEKKQQVLLYLNRRGFAPLTLCRACGSRLNCPDCSTWLVYHRYKNTLSCHYCGFERQMPKICPDCNEPDSLVFCGPGVERLESEVRSSFPNARLLSVTSDTAGNLKQIDSFIGMIEKGEIDIIIGTQMLAKGHHFPSLTLVAAVDADSGLTGGDLRAGERTYQLLHQVAGRAGRGMEGSSVIIQTYMPEHPVMQALKNWDRDGFLHAEVDSRRISGMPPFSRLISILLTGLNEEVVRRAANSLALRIPEHEDFIVLGPVPAPINLMKKRYRYRFLVKAGRGVPTQGIVSAWLKSVAIPSSITLKADVDPYGFL